MLQVQTAVCLPRITYLYYSRRTMCYTCTGVLPARPCTVSIKFYTSDNVSRRRSLSEILGYVVTSGMIGTVTELLLLAERCRRMIII